MLVSLSFGAGAVLMASLIYGGVVLYTSSAARTKPWISNAVGVSGPPGFNLSDDRKSLELTYTVENFTGDDYKVPKAKDFHVFTEFKDGTLSAEVPPESLGLAYPFFLPGKARINVTLPLSSGPLFAEMKQATSESPKDFHERLRSVMNERIQMKSIRVYDEVHHYLLIFPAWERSKPNE